MASCSRYDSRTPWRCGSRGQGQVIDNRDRTENLYDNDDFDRLPEGWRRTLQLRRVQGLSHRVESRLFHARFPMSRIVRTNGIEVNTGRL